MRSMGAGHMKAMRLSIPFLLMAVMALALCALCAALGLVCASAYGEGQTGSGDETTPLTLMAGSIDESALQAASSSKSTTYNIGSGSCLCIDPETEYTIVGTSTNGATVTIKGGSDEAHAVHVTLDNVTIDQRSVKPSEAPVTVLSGYAVIKLRGTNVLKAGYKDVSVLHDWGFAGLCVQKGSTCIITSADGDGSTNGSLEAHGGHDKYGGAGIGTNYDDDTGAIYINGGTIRAYGAHCAAGIGSGCDGECYTTCIQGGDVWAWGGEYAAGIGGGDAVGVSTGGTTHDLWIHGGTVHAYGGDNGGAGIGGSEGGGTDKITITGGNITAYGCGEHGSKGSAAGIGSGDGKVCGTINIDQGSGELTIDARGYGEGAGIGGANCESGTINIKLRGGTITASGGPQAAGIGGGGKPSGTINIKGNGTVNAYAGMQAAAIGAGDQKHSGSINIDGNSSRLNISAYAPKSQDPNESFVSYAAIIGSGDGSSGDIYVNNANIDLYALGRGTLNGAGIGTGSSNDLSLKDGGISNITVKNAQIRFHSVHKMLGAGIGAGYGSNIKTITLDNVDYDGPTIGSSCSDRFATNENSMQSISIANSTVKAIARGDNKYNHAGIGTGPYGTIESIAIASSNIEAKGVNGGAGIGSGGIYVNPSQVLHLASSDGKCGSVTITGRGTVKATGSQGGAGIGSGTLTSVYGDISISNGATVEVVGGLDSGAGIGGGKLCSCANITIDGATVTATGGPAAAGIGSGGVSDTTVVGGSIQTAWNTICGNITITGASNVTATGGDGAAGIGLGQGAQMESSSGITISGGTVNAMGGARGAGIGAGRECGLGRGAEARRIRIEGEAKVTATGGAGAAGIGGGYEGGVEQCHINLSVNDPRRAFVIARGGVGAAGIGAGASSRQSTSKGTMDGAHDAKNLSFGGGFVAAYGGDGSESSEEGRTGAGAGIGGGSYQGDLESCVITGGVIVAHGGAKASGGPSGGIGGQDIGRGGSRDGGGGDGSDSIYIQGGTVVGGVNENESVLVAGGSVTHRFTHGKATKSNFANEPVYQNAIAIDTKPLVAFEFDGQKFYSLGLVETSADYFHCVDVFAIESGENRATAYLYLPAGEANATTAFVKPADATLSYYGTTTAEQYPNYTTNTNVLKMGAPIAIVPKRRSDALIEGVPYIVRVGDLDGALGDNDTACYTSATNATYQGYRMADDTMNSDVSQVPIYTNYATSGRTYTDVTVIPGAAGTKMKLTARLNGASAASDLYWGDGEAVFEKDITEAPPSVKITNADELSKVYDGQPAIDPIFVKTPESCAITKIRCLGQWGTVYDKTVTSTTDPYMPTAIGYYEVTVWAEYKGHTVTDSASFKIVDPDTPKQRTSLTVSDPSKTYDTQPVSPSVQCTSDGNVTLSYKKQDGTALSGAPKDAGDYVVAASVPMTVTYETANAEEQFSIKPKEGSLTLAAIGDGEAGKATVTAHLSGVYDDVNGKDIVFMLDNDSGKTATAQLAPKEDGTFTATCAFSGVKPGRHVATAGYSNPNYLVDDAMVAFDVDVPLPAVSATITEDPTKFYDGSAVRDPAVQVVEDGVDVTSKATVTYSYQPGSSNPSETGVYLVTATAVVDGASASNTRLFLIRKCPVGLSVEAPDKAYDGQPVSPVVTVRAENGLEIEPNATLTYYRDQGDGTYGEASTNPPVDVGSYYVKAERPGDVHYRAAEAGAKFSILDKPAPFLYVDMPESLVYNAKAVNYPLVWEYSDGEVEIIYYDEDGAVLKGEPKDAGSYSVEVSVPETAKYSAASSGKIPFTILPRPAVLSISATGDQSTESAEIVVSIAGALSDVVGNYIGISVAYDDQPSTMSTQSVDGARLTAQGAASVQAEIASDGESLSATHEFPHVGAGEYEVTASYSDDPNYAVKDATEHFDKRMRGYRISAEDKTVTFGDAPFVVQAEVQDTNGSEVENPALSYSQVSSEDLPMVDEDSAVLGDNGTVSVQNAGVSAVRVDVAGDDTHEGNFDYSVITVEKAPLSLAVTAKDKTADGKPAEVAYSVDDATYPTPYSGDVELTYFRANADVRTQLDAAPTESGSYVVVATTAGDRNYNAAVAEASFKIQASSDPDNPDNPVNPDNPDNPNNPQKPDTKPTSGNDSSGKNGGTSASNGPRTGDNVVVWPLVAFSAFGFALFIYSARRIRVNSQQDDNMGQTG